MAQKEPMTESEIGALVQAEIAASIDYDRGSEFRKDRVRAIEYMNGVVSDLPTEEGRSTITSRDVADTIGFILPGLRRVFFSGDEIVHYEPVGPEDEQTAKQATDYVNYILSELDAYEIFGDVFEDALLHANGIVKHWWEPYDKVDVNIFHNLTEAQLSLILSDPNVEVIEHSTKEYTDPAQAPQMDGQPPALPNVITLHDVKIKRTEKLGRVKLAAVPPEEFLIDSKATSIRAASFVGHRSLNPRSSLIEQGYDYDVVAKLPAFGGTLSFDRVQIARREQIGSINLSSGLDESMDMVETIECYIKCDYNGDGIAETLKVLMGGSGSSDVLDWEEWEDEYPFTDFVAERVPHRWLGRSIFNEVEDMQRTKTALLRQMLDNLYAANIPDRVVNEEMIVNMDAVYDRQIGNVIRVSGDPNAAVTTSFVPFVAKEALTGLSYADEIIKRRTGVSQDTLALDINALQGQTATAVNAAQSGAYSKIELIARNFAEMGFKRFFKALLKLIVENQDKPRTIRLRSEWVEFDPRSWNADMDCTVSVGLGSGSKEKDVMMLQGILAEQKQIIAQLGPDNPLCGLVEYHNTFKKLIEAGGIKNTRQFVKDINPAAMAQQANQPPKPDPKQQEAAAKLQLQQQESAANIQFMQQEAAAKLQLEREKMQAQMQLQREQYAMELEQMKQKNLLDLQHKQEILQINAQLKREEMANELALTEQANLIHGMTNAGSADTNLPHQSVPQE